MSSLWPWCLQIHFYAMKDIKIYCLFLCILTTWPDFLSQTYFDIFVQTVAYRLILINEHLVFELSKYEPNNFYAFECVSVTIIVTWALGNLVNLVKWVGNESVLWYLWFTWSLFYNNFSWNKNAFRDASWSRNSWYFVCNWYEINIYQFYHGFYKPDKC